MCILGSCGLRALWSLAAGWLRRRGRRRWQHSRRRDLPAIPEIFVFSRRNGLPPGTLVMPAVSRSTGSTMECACRHLDKFADPWLSCTGGVAKASPHVPTTPRQVFWVVAWFSLEIVSAFFCRIRPKHGTARDFGSARPYPYLAII